MFAQNEILVFSPGRNQEGLERLAWIHGLMAPQPGFKEAIVAKYLGDGTRHTIMRFWEDEAAYQAFRATPDGNYGRNRPEGLYVNEPVVTPLVSYGEIEGNATGNFLVKVRLDAEPGAWDAYQAAQQGMLEDFGHDLPGLVWERQFRGKDTDSSIVVIRLSSRDAYEELLEGPLFEEVRKRTPAGVTRGRTECFEIVREVEPKR